MRKKNLSHTHDLCLDGKFLPANPVNLMERGEYNHIDLCLDGKFLPANPVNLMERGEYNHVDLMVGVTKVYFFGKRRLIPYPPLKKGVQQMHIPPILF